MNTETVAAIVGTKGDIFRLLNRVPTQMERIAKINGLDRFDKTVVGSTPQALCQLIAKKYAQTITKVSL